MFNENNKQVRESNKNSKSEQEISELIKTNDQIQKAALCVDEHIAAAQKFGQGTLKELDEVDSCIESLRVKYSKKNQLIDDCDEKFEEAEKLIQEMTDESEAQSEKIDSILALIDKVSPINNLMGATDNQKFVEQRRIFTEQLKVIQDEVYQRRDEVEKLGRDLGDYSEELRTVVTPLSELEDREVLTDEIVEVKTKEDELIAKLKYCYQDVSALTGIIKGLEE